MNATRNAPKKNEMLLGDGKRRRMTRNHWKMIMRTTVMTMSMTALMTMVMIMAMKTV